MLLIGNDSWVKVLNVPLLTPYNPAYYTVPRQSRCANSDGNDRRTSSRAGDSLSRDKHEGCPSLCALA